MICELPDDLLLYVLSSLTAKEAGRTSVLSKRWRQLWVYNPTLNFDYPEALHWDWTDRKLRELGFPEYVNCVDKVLTSHKASAIDEFRVRADINFIRGTDISKSIDSWFRFATAKRVKRLEIDLSPSHIHVVPRHTLPSLSMCNSLTSLTLGCININGEILQSFLCSCKALEYLSVKYSDSLTHLKVCGPSLNLQHLKIYSLSAMEQLMISAPKLESLYYWGPEISVQFKSTPKLVQVHIGGSYAEDLTNICSDLSNYLSQIKVLRIDYHRLLEKPVEESARLFTRLEKLDVHVFPNYYDDLYNFTSMIKACPFLKHFKLRLWPFQPHWPDLNPDTIEPYKYYTTREQLKWEACPHYHLEILEILGFMGYPIDLEFVAYLIKSAKSLNKIIADTRDVLWKGSPKYYEDTKERRQARKQAKRIRANLKRKGKCKIILEIV